MSEADGGNGAAAGGKQILPLRQAQGQDDKDWGVTGDDKVVGVAQDDRSKDDRSKGDDKSKGVARSEAITEARLSLGIVGGTASTGEQLRFRMDHALARDAVHAEMDVAGLERGCEERGWEYVVLRSAVRGGRGEYLKRPDLGRRLDEGSRGELVRGEWDVVFVVADGLSSLAVERHALLLMDAVRAGFAGCGLAGWSVGPVCVVREGRVAVGDEVGAAMGARMVVMMIGERPGLSAADSLGVYVTWEPRVGRMDAERNCVSNVRDGGLGYAEAAGRVVYLMESARKLGLTGVGLKDGVGVKGIGSRE